MNEIAFDKYSTKGAGYHWSQISWNPWKRNAFLVARYNNIIKILKANCPQTVEGIKILDVGCGDGALSYLLSKLGGLVFGIDLSINALTFARRRTKKTSIQFIQANSYSIPWEDDYFDAVIASDVIEHVQNTKLFLAEIKRVTRKDGLIVISTPIRYTERPLDKMHVFEWFPEELKSIILSVFPKSEFYQSHPLLWTEIYLRSRLLLLLVNLLSLLKNVFGNLNTRFIYKSLQYSVSKK